MNKMFEALYNERRNAIPSWQGYHYQGMIAIARFLEGLVEKFKSSTSENKAEILKLKIEWIEDFILFENDSPKEIYQVKKTLTNKERKEVLYNFIIQFKIYGNETKWVIAYSDTELGADDLELTKEEFDQYYREHIEEKWIEQINLLERHYTETDYWKTNLNLRNSDSSCKEIRAYLRKWFDETGQKYTNEIEQKAICDGYLTPLKERLKYKEEDFEIFKKSLEIRKIESDEIDNKCKDTIEELAVHIKRNETLTTQDILDKLYSNIYQKMMRLKSKSAQENFEYDLEDIKKIFLDKDNTISRWMARLYREKEKLLEDIENSSCLECEQKGERCSECILSTIQDWNMRNLIDNINLEYALFSPEKAMESIENKLSDIKHDLIVDMIDMFKTQIELENNDVLALNHKYTLSTIIGGNTRQNEKNLKGILNNYWDHSIIYSDYESVLTQNYRHSLSEKELSILQGADAERTCPGPSFSDIRETEFIDYEDVKL